MISLPGKIDSLLVTHIPNVRYLTGFTGSLGCALVSGQHKLFFTDFRYQRQSAREVRGFQVRIIKGPLLEGFCRYAAAHRLRLGNLGVESSRLSHWQYLLIKRLLKGTRLVDAGGTVEKERRVKKRPEIAGIRRASAIADEAFDRLRRFKLAGRSERDVAWLLESFMRQAGSGPLPFEIIVASGPRSAMPHGTAGDRVVRKGELVVIDMGASVDGYCCDITRTFATGPLSAGQVKIYEIVRKAQEAALSAAGPGVAVVDVDKAARDHISAAGFGREFGHSLGHGVGLEAHEAPLLAPGSDDTLEAGMTITIEPGIYTGRSGVRIEDTVLITRSGAVSLTGFPRELITLK